jgi:hypothetical protein
MSQNLVSASLTEEKIAEIMAALDTIEENLDFLIALSPDDIKGLYNPGHKYLSLIEKANYVANAHPEILPRAFDVEEFKRDYQLTKDLTRIFSRMAGITEGLDNTVTAVASDTLAGTLEIYAAVKLYRDKVPGLDVIADEMAIFFHKTKRKSENSET